MEHIHPPVAGILSVMSQLSFSMIMKTLRLKHQRERLENEIHGTPFTRTVYEEEKI